MFRRLHAHLIVAIALALLSAGALTAQAPPSRTLYVLSIGVSEHKHDPEHKTWMSKGVKFAAKDARDVARLFERQQRKLFDRVASVVLTNDQATKANIEQHLDWLRPVVRPGDAVVLFIASHGGAGPGGYSFVTYDSSPTSDPSQDVTGARLRQALAGLPGTRLLMLDTCHAAAAAAGGAAPQTAPLTDLASQDGVVVWAACGSSEGSVELPALENGLFTHTAIDGLEGRADFNGDGVVTLAEADAYVANAVAKMSGGKQNPAMQRPASIPSGFNLVRVTRPTAEPLALPTPGSNQPGIANGPRGKMPF